MKLSTFFGRRAERSTDAPTAAAPPAPPPPPLPAAPEPEPEPAAPAEPEARPIVALADHPKVEAPARLRRGHYRNNPERAVTSAVAMLDRIRQALGRESLAEVRSLDIGCGDKFSVALIDRRIPIGKYHGVDVNRGAIDYLNGAVFLPNFSYKHIDV